MAATVALAAPAAADTTTTLNATGQGAHLNLGGPPGNGGNYAITSSGFASRGYATFDLSSISGQITSAALTLPNASCGGMSSAPAGSTITVWDVSTPADQLGTSVPVAVYTDLGSGTAYGSTTLATANPPDVVVTFTAEGLAAAQGAEGQPGFSVGFALTASGSVGVFELTRLALGCIPTLTVTLADVVDTPIVNAESLGWIALAVLLAAGGVLIVRRRRPQTDPELPI